MGRDTRRILARNARRTLAGGRTALVLLAGGLTALALLAGHARADDGARIVTHDEQGYSVHVDGTNVVQVLTEVGQFAGFTVEAPDNFYSPLTLTLEDVPLDQLLRRLLRNENYIIVYRGGVQKTSISGEKIDRIFLLSQPAAGPAPKPQGAGSPLAGPAGPGARPVPVPGRGTPPPPLEEDDEGADLATRAARARARAEARRAALGEVQPPGAPIGPDGMPEAARMVQNPEDFTPPPGEHDAPHGDVPPGFDGDDGTIPDDY